MFHRKSILCFSADKFSASSTGPPFLFIGFLLPFKIVGLRGPFEIDFWLAMGFSDRFKGAGSGMELNVRELERGLFLLPVHPVLVDIPESFET